jgi:creatinine amidohydrolase
MDRAKSESGVMQPRLTLKNTYTPIWWYAGYPNHYDGDGTTSNLALGKLEVDNVVKDMSEVLRGIKADRQTLILQKEFFDRVNAEQK